MSAILEQIQRGLRGALRRAQAIYEPYVARVRPYVEPTITRLRVRYDRLEPREKTLVRIAGAVTGVFLAYNLVYLPVQGLRAELRQRTETRRREIVEVRRQVKEYEQLKLELAAAEKRTVQGQGKNFSLFSAVEGMLTKSVGVAKIGSITPGDDKKISNELVQHNVQITLNGVTLPEVVDTLYGINTLAVPVVVSDLHIKNGQTNAIFDVDMTSVAIGKNG